MNRISVILLVLVWITSLSCSKKPLFYSKKLEPADQRYAPGSMEWIDKLHYDSESGISYGCFNNNNDLMIRVKVSDRDVIMKMFATGFTVLIDTTGKKNSQFEIKYPLPQGMQTMSHPMNDRQQGAAFTREGRPKPDMKNQYGTATNNIELVGFSDEAVKNTRLNTRDGDGITAWIHFDSTSAMFYEIKIPFSEISSTGKPGQHYISIGLQSGKMDLPTGNFPSGRPPGGGGPGGGPGGGQARPDGMEHGDGNLPPQMGADQSLSQPIEIWMKRIEFQKTN